MAMEATGGITKYFHEETAQWFELLIEGIIILDEEQRFIYANQAYRHHHAHMDDYEYERCKGKAWREIRPGTVAHKMFATGKPIYNYHRVLDDGSESYTDVVPYWDDGNIVGALIVVRDMLTLRTLIQKVQEKDKYISQLNDRVKGFYKTRYTFQDVVGRDPYLQLAKKAAQTDSSVFLMGESGTGKEVIAQSIHQASYRGGQPFVDVNCASLPESLLESELFGYVPGAFTGASKNGKIGLFELANGGTLFLDEITEMPLHLQSKLLRVLQERQIRRLGDSKNIEVDVRVIAATNRNIDQDMDENRFRRDLFYRLAVIVIQLPPLRERKQDFDCYVQYFLRPLEQQYKKRFRLSKEAEQLMHSFKWPGNIRELQNVLEYCCMVAGSDLITPECLPYYMRWEMNEPKGKDERFSARPNETLEKTMRRVEQETIGGMLEHYGTSTAAKKDIAKALGISVATLYNKMKKLGIS